MSEDKLLTAMKSKVDRYMDDMDEVIDNTSKIRSDLIQDMLVLKGRLLDPDARIDPEVELAKFGMFDSMRQMLDSLDKAKIKKADMHLKQHTDEQLVNTGRAAVETLMQYTHIDARNSLRKMGSGTITAEDETRVDAKIEEALSNAGVIITSGEHRDDHTDLSDPDEA